MTGVQCTTCSTFLLEGNCGGQFEDGSQMERLLQYVIGEQNSRYFIEQTIPLTLITKKAVPV